MKTTGTKQARISTTVLSWKTSATDGKEYGTVAKGQQIAVLAVNVFRSCEQKSTGCCDNVAKKSLH